MNELDACDGARMSDDAQAPQHVLVVDDTEVVRTVACEMLSVLGCSVEAVKSGRAALALVATRSAFDLILMDCQMPGIDGLETTRQLIKAHPDADLQIFAMSAHTSTSDQAAQRAAGMAGHLAKPFRLDELKTLLDSIP